MLIIDMIYSDRAARARGGCPIDSRPLMAVLKPRLQFCLPWHFDFFFVYDLTWEVDARRKRFNSPYTNFNCPACRSVLD